MFVDLNYSDETQALSTMGIALAVFPTPTSESDSPRLQRELDASELTRRTIAGDQAIAGIHRKLQNPRGTNFKRSWREAGLKLGCLR